MSPTEMSREAEPEKAAGALDGETAKQVVAMVLARIRRMEGLAPRSRSAVTLLASESEVLDPIEERAEWTTESWPNLHIRRVFGPLSLRKAFNEALDEAGAGGETVLLVDDRDQLPLDVVRNARMQRLMRVRIEDIVAGLTGQPCAQLDSDLEDQIRANLHAFADIATQRTFEGNVRPSDVREMLAAVELAVPADLGTLGAGKLLVYWLEEPPVRLADWHLEELRDALGVEGVLVGRAARDGTLANLVESGLLMPDERADADMAAAYREVMASLELETDGLGNSKGEVATRIRSLADRVVREWEGGGRKLAALPGWGTADQRWTTLSARVNRGDCYPHLRAPLVHELHRCREAAREPSREELAEWTEGRLEALGAHRFAEEERGEVDALRTVWRVRRFLDAVERDFVGPAGGELGGDTWSSWALSVSADICWADRCVAELRRYIPGFAGGSAMREVCERARDAVLEYRDGLNRRFAGEAVEGWEDLAIQHEGFAGPGAAGERAVSAARLTDAYVAPLLKAGEKVFLVVLDGCDLGSFYEIVESLEEGTGKLVEERLGVEGGSISIGAPDAQALNGADDFALLEELAEVRPAFSLLPSTTEHARRAIFAGRIPGKGGLSSADAEANVSNDRKALGDNPYIGNYPHELYLKGALKDGQDELREAFQRQDEGPRLLSAVFNFVDDALASHQTTPIPRWTPERVGETGLPAVLVEAVANGFHVVMTADHGHTPYLNSERSLQSSGGPARYHVGDDPPSEEWLRLEGASVPGDEPVWVAWRGGEFRGGTNHRGYHGGASLGEMVIPLAYVGLVRENVENMTGREPTWWRSPAEAPTTPRRARRLQSLSGGMPKGFVEHLRTLGLGLSDLEIEVAEALESFGQLTGKQLADKLGRPKFTVVPAVERLRTNLRKTKLEGALSADETGTEGEETYLLDAEWR